MILSIKAVAERDSPYVEGSHRTGTYFAFLNFEKVEGAEAAKKAMDKWACNSQLSVEFALGPTAKVERNWCRKLYASHQFSCTRSRPCTHHTPLPTSPPQPK